MSFLRMSRYHSVWNDADKHFNHYTTLGLHKDTEKVDN